MIRTGFHNQSRPVHRALIGGLAGGLLFALAGPARGQEKLAVDAVEIERAAEAAVEEDLLNVRPGFQLPIADDIIREQIAIFNAHLDQSNWGEAFRVLSDLSGDGLDAMVPVGDDGLHLAVRALIQRQALAMPVEGRRAFRLYFDGQAKEQLAAVRDHPLPGSDQQLALAQRLVDRLLASSVGGEAAELLGDFYFERGNFARAGQNWAFALEHGSATGRDALRLLVKQAWAAARAGEQDKAQGLYEQLGARYSQAFITVGGVEVDALALLGQELASDEPDLTDGPADASQPVYRLPRKGAQPVWNLTFLSPKNASKITQSRQNTYYYSNLPPNNLPRHVPPVVADDERVYFHWLGAVFALDRAGGKLLWTDGSVGEAALTGSHRQSSNAGDPNSYQIAQSERTLLVVSSENDDEQVNQFNDAPFNRYGRDKNYAFDLRAYNKADGATLWTSTLRDDWRLVIENGATADASLVGRVLVNDDAGYAIVHPVGHNELYLRKFDPDTGIVDWTMPLGSADPLAFQNEVKLLPQPQLLLGRGVLYVLTNNGALVAVDTAAGQIVWGVHMDVPLGVGVANRRTFQGTTLQMQLEKLANPNGSGTLLMHKGELYAKQHHGATLYNLDPLTGHVNWSRDGLDPDSRLIGIDDQQFYMMHGKVRGYALDGERALAWNSPNDTFKYDQAGALLFGEQILALGNGRLRLARKDNGDFVSTFKGEDYLGQKGGRLYHWDNLIVCINRTQITAYQLETVLDIQPEQP